MAKNITITTANGDFTLTGSRKMKVGAANGTLSIDLNGDGAVVKTYALTSVLGWSVGAGVEKKGNRFEAMEKDAIQRLADSLNLLRGTHDNTDDDTVLLFARNAVAASDAIVSARTRAASYATMLAKGKDKRAAKKVAAAAPVAAVVATPDINAHAAAEKAVAAVLGKGKGKGKKVAAAA